MGLTNQLVQIKVFGGAQSKERSKSKGFCQHGAIELSDSVHIPTICYNQVVEIVFQSVKIARNLAALKCVIAWHEHCVARVAGHSLYRGGGITREHLHHGTIVGLLCYLIQQLAELFYY